MPDVPLFEIDELHVSSATGTEPVTEILAGVSLVVRAGEIDALIAPSGSGASALAAAVLGSPRHPVTSGRVRCRGDDITTWDADVRAKAGLFLAFPYPEEISGVSILHLLRQALNARRGSEMGVRELRRSLLDWMERLDIEASFLERSVNEGFSAAERQQHEILQMAVLEPVMAILDATGSGLDGDVIETTAAGIRTVRAGRPELGTLTITHSPRLADHLQPDRIHILLDGRIVASGGPELAKRLETEGYESFR